MRMPSKFYKHDKTMLDAWRKSAIYKKEDSFCSKNCKTDTGEMSEILYNVGVVVTFKRVNEVTG